MENTNPTSTILSTTTQSHSIYNDFYVHPQVRTTFLRFDTIAILIGIIFVGLALYGRVYYARINNNLKTGLFYIGMTFFGIACIIAGVLSYLQSDGARIPLTFSSHAMSASVWEAYKTVFTEKTTARTVDPSRYNITTSEGESYTMLRAVWLDDKDTFDASYTWTKNHLSRPQDALFSWQFGKRNDGTYGVIAAEGGENTATDADSDIALALIFAYARWQDPQYLHAARATILDIWNKEVVIINGKPYLAANNLEKFSNKNNIIVNPSYFSPATYRIFSHIDKTHPWMSLVDTSYITLQAAMTNNLDATTTAYLIPDWVQINKKTGAITAISSPSLTTQYSYDALRAPWRIALDWKWNKDPRAQKTLDLMSFLKNSWRQKGQIAATYSHSGVASSDYEAPATYGGSIGYFIVSDPEDAEAVYKNKLLVLFDPDNNTWRETLSYYDDNWAWFGMALYNNQLPNLALGIPELNK